MARTKIDYGIDLGTTNSSIAQMKNGNSVIRKNEYQMDTTASCVHFNKKGTRQVGKKAYNNLGLKGLIYAEEQDIMLPQH